MDVAGPGDPPELGGTNGLVAAILGRTEVALFENVYSAYAVEAQRLAVRLVGEPSAAQDAVHVAYLEILRQLLHGRRWNDPAEARAAVLRNTRWASLNALRAERRKRAAVAQTAAQVQPAMDEWARSEARMLCEQIVGGLPARDRQVIEIRYLDGRSNAEGATLIGITEKAFELRLARAVKRARRAARSSELLPALASWSSGVPARSRRGGTWRRARRSVVQVVAATAATVIGASMLGRSADVAAPGSHRAAAAVQVPQESETLDDTIVTDAVVAKTATTMQVFALGWGNQCRCRLLWRSLDAGASWRRAPAPYPPTSVVSRAVGCDRSLEIPFCFGHTAGGRTGLVLRVDGGRLLYFSPLGGIRLSTDAGRSWSASVLIIESGP